MKSDNLKPSHKEYARIDDTVDPELVIPVALLDGTKNFLKHGYFIADTDKNKAFADALADGAYFYYPELRAYVMSLATYTEARTLNLPTETAADPEFYLSKGFLKKYIIEGTEEDPKEIFWGSNRLVYDAADDQPTTTPFATEADFPF